MKRILLRVAALGIVVVLGAFAIAQAQRRANNAAPPEIPRSSADKRPAEPPPATSGKAPTVVRGQGTSGDLPPVSEGPALPLPNPYRGGDAGDETPPATLQINARQDADDAKLLPRTGPLSSPFAGRSEFDGRSAANVQQVGADDDMPTTVGGPNVAPASDPAAVAKASGRPAGERNPRQALATARQPAPLKTPITLGETSADGMTYDPLDTTMPGSPGPNTDAMDPLADPIVSRQPVMTGETYGGMTHVPSDPMGYAPGVSTMSDRAGQGTGRPGSRQLEGPQSPQLTISKSAPEEIQVGKPAPFRVTIRNVGRIAASGVQVRDQIPRGTEFVSAKPRAMQGAPGELIWDLGTLGPGEETTVEMQVRPLVEGEIGSVATISFNADASVRTIATQPKLVVKTSAPEEVLVGEEIAISIEVSNPGTGTATGVVLEEHIPPGLQHAEGTDLEYPIGDLPPGESRKLQLTMTATGDGQVVNVLKVVGDDGLSAEHRLAVNVLVPKLQVGLVGSKRRFLEREATYQVQVHNPGTATAEQVELVAYLPTGLKFVKATHNGHYVEADRAVHWQLQELSAQERGQVELVTLPIESGQQSLRLRGTAAKGVADEQEHPVSIEGIAAIMFEVGDVSDPVEVNGETTYEIRVLNQGTKAARQVQVWIDLPPEMEAIDAKGPAQYAVQGNRVVFDPLPHLAPKADTTYRLRVRALQAGDLRAVVRLRTAEMRQPVTKEESTQVYTDQ